MMLTRIHLAIDNFYVKLARVKNSQRVWGLSAPILLALAVHYGRNWEIPLLAYVAANLMPDEWDPEAQRIHFLVSYIIISLIGWWGWLWWPLALVIEGYFDVKYEPDPFWWGGFTDLASYTAGLVAWLIPAFHRWWL